MEGNTSNHSSHFHGANGSFFFSLFVINRLGIGGVGHVTGTDPGPVLLGGGTLVQSGPFQSAVHTIYWGGGRRERLFQFFFSFFFFLFWQRLIGGDGFLFFFLLNRYICTNEGRAWVGSRGKNG